MISMSRMRVISFSVYLFFIPGVAKAFCVPPMVNNGAQQRSICVNDNLQLSGEQLRGLTYGHKVQWPSFSFANKHQMKMVSNMNQNGNENLSVTTNDPIVQEIEQLKKLDMNVIINTAVIVVMSIAILSKLATVDSGMMRGWTASEMAVRIPVDNFYGYSSILAQAPISTKAVTSATVYTIGDFISQRTEGKDIGDLDRGRILRSLLAGLIGHGPLSHVWYDWSEDIFNNVLHLTEWWSFIPKVAIDQTLWGPFWNNMYIVLLGAMKLESPQVIWSDIKRTTIPLVVSGLKLWPLAHCITYGLVPVPYRLLWVDLVEIIWVTILATQAAGPQEKEIAEGGEISS